MINFRKITEENFDAIIKMKRPEGENFVASNAVSLAQAWLYQDAGNAFPFAIYNIAPFTKNLPRLRRTDGFSGRIML